MRIDLTVLGSGTVAPTPHRTAAAHWVGTKGVSLLLDCGAGTLFRAAGFGIDWPRLTHVVISHFHVDHWGELPHLLFAMRYGCEPPRSDPLVLIGPVGLGARLEHLTRAYGDWILEPGYPLTVTEIRPGDDMELGEGVRLESHATPHTDESLAYAIHSGEARLVYTGDTGVSHDLAEWATNCSLLLCECSLPDDRAIDQHLTPTQAGEMARQANAQRLVLTHFYPPVEAPDPADVARQVFSGSVVAARDGDHFAIVSGEG